MNHNTAVFSSPKRGVVVLLISIIIISIIIRIVSYIIDPISPRDSFIYFYFIEELNRNGFYSQDFISEFNETQWVSPLYIYLCHLLSSVFGIPVNLSCISISIIATSFTAIPIYHLTHLLFKDNQTSLFAALLSVIHPSSISIGYMPLRDSLNYFLVAVLLFYLFDLFLQKSFLSALISGIILSLCVFCRFENIDLLVFSSIVLLLGLIRKRNRMQRITRLAVLYTAFTGTVLFLSCIVNKEIFNLGFIINSITRYI